MAKLHKEDVQAVDALTFPPLADRDHAVSRAYGAWREKLVNGEVTEGIVRSTVVLDPEGTVTPARHLAIPRRFRTRAPRIRAAPVRNCRGNRLCPRPCNDGGRGAEPDGAVVFIAAQQLEDVGADQLPDVPVRARQAHGYGGCNLCHELPVELR